MSETSSWLGSQLAVESEVRLETAAEPPGCLCPLCALRHPLLLGSQRDRHGPAIAVCMVMRAAGLLVLPGVESGRIGPHDLDDGCFSELWALSEPSEPAFFTTWGPCCTQLSFVGLTAEKLKSDVSVMPWPQIPIPMCENDVSLRAAPQNAYREAQQRGCEARSEMISANLSLQHS